MYVCVYIYMHYIVDQQMLHKPWRKSLSIMRVDEKFARLERRSRSRYLYKHRRTVMNFALWMVHIYILYTLYLEIET